MALIRAKPFGVGGFSKPPQVRCLKLPLAPVTKYFLFRSFRLMDIAKRAKPFHFFVTERQVSGFAGVGQAFRIVADI
jgi:hypothetical protein